MKTHKLLPLKPDNNMRSAASQLFARNPNANPVDYYCAMAAAAREIVQPDHDTIRLVEALEGLLSITSESYGVTGYHLNGEVAEWGEFEEVAAAEEALAAFRKKGDEIPMHPCVMQLDKLEIDK